MPNVSVPAHSRTCVPAQSRTLQFYVRGIWNGQRQVPEVIFDRRDGSSDCNNFSVEGAEALRDALDAAIREAKEQEPLVRITYEVTRSQADSFKHAVGGILARHDGRTYSTESVPR